MSENQKENIVVATIKSWNIANYNKIKETEKDFNWYIITSPEELSSDSLRRLNPKYIFFPHWSEIIPPEIYENHECVVFHMTDLPFGRGGSPLQNLLVRNIYDTKISALRVVKELDAGDIYMKSGPISLRFGNADQMLAGVSDVIFQEMIPHILHNNPKPVPQTGEVTNFRRRTSVQSCVYNIDSIERLYDYIRMLDGEGYPKAFVYMKNFLLTFSEVRKQGSGLITTCKIRQSKGINIIPLEVKTKRR